MNEANAPANVRARAGVALLLLGLFLCGNWILPLVDRDEPRFAEASREMMQRGDYVVPYFNGEPRYDKPPLIYWCQIAAFKALGENEFSARLPSALFAVATALVLMAFGRRVADENSGLWAALIFGTCLQTLVHARLAVADMAMVFFVTLSIWSGWELVMTMAARWWFVFSVAMGLGFLAKGPVAWLPLVGLLWARGKIDQRGKAPVWRVIAAFGLALVIAALWGVPALRETHGEFFNIGIGKHVVQRSFSTLEGHGAKSVIGYILTLPIFFITFFASFFPWSIDFARRLRIRLKLPAEADLLGNYLLIQAALFFIVFSLSKTKLPHYTLPAFPALALWLAREWTRSQPAIARRKWVAAMALLAFLVTTAGFIGLRKAFPTRAIHEVAAPYLKPNMALGAIGYAEPSLVWEFRNVITNKMQEISESELKAFVAANPSFVLIAPSETVKANTSAFPTNAIRVNGFGVNLVKGRPVDLTAIIAQ
jgi:4-amino-4-deoxy-L-arabinose transferase-like glycosyltransferase